MSAQLEPEGDSSSRGGSARRARPDKPGSTVVEPRTAAALVAASMGRVLGEVATAIRVTAGSPPTRRGKQQSSQAVQCEEKGQVEPVECVEHRRGVHHADFSHLSPACSASRASSARDKREESAQAAKVQTTSMVVSAAQTAQKMSSITTAITSGVLRPWIP